MKKLVALLFPILVLWPVRCGLAQTTQLPMTPAELREFAKEQDARQEELVAIEKEMARAIQWNTGTIFRRVYGDDFQGTVSTGQVMDKTGWIASVENSGIKYSSFVVSDIKVRMFQDTAVVTCLWSSRGMQGSRNISRQWRVMHVYVYGQRGWKTVASQETLLPGSVN